METKPIRVLVVEDNPGDAKLLRAMLADAKGPVTFALEFTDRLAAALARLSAGGIGLILLDLSLPDSQGMATFARLAAQAGQVPILVLSGLDDEALALRTVQEGAQDYLLKGHIDGQLLVRAMRYAIERKRAEAERARYAAELREKNVQMEASLHMASEIQRALLPQHYPTFPRGTAPADSTLRFAQFYRPSGAVGGDFFDVLAVSEKEAGLFICDVMGRGVRAALVTAMVKTLIEEIKPAAGDPGRFLSEFNRRLLGIMGQTKMPVFISAFYLVADALTGSARYANAGHPSPLLLRREAKDVSPLPLAGGTPGPPLGLIEEAVYPVLERKLARHDVVLLFTDGVYEVRSSTASFGEAGLLAALRKRIGLSAAELLEELWNELVSFSGTKKFEDDVCFLALEIARLGSPG
jgi:sigma-B regulation protein RsbU (phosphoserine phosphatase)